MNIKKVVKRGRKMILIVCVDEKNGMMFNNRRQSKDRILSEHILKIVDNKKMWMNSYSKGFFEGQENLNIIVDDQFIEKIGKEDYCFLENVDVNTIIDKVDRIIVYNWNRHYPADKYFNINFNEWVVDSKDEFSGSSHEKITEKIYIRGNK